MIWAVGCESMVSIEYLRADSGNLRYHRESMVSIEYLRADSGNLRNHCESRVRQNANGPRLRQSEESL
jgi:hypothetical protein